MSTNRLANETSPYLLQHAHNPVDWYPWGEEAFARARAEDKPLLLSVGYSACHWCHVMERESFENPETAGLMNRLFVNVKVDREERPDVDHIYMQAVQSLTGHGGWPMTVFLAPDGTPFYGGTYFPPQDRHGLPGFPRLLQAIAEAWQSRRGEVVQSGQQLKESLGQTERLRALRDAAERRDPLRRVPGAVRAVRRGVGRARRRAEVPPADDLGVRAALLASASGTPSPQRMVHTTLIRMARGGMYDHLGGGFARYSVDAHWMVPHFEKMLYDNAQLASLYLHAWLAFGDPECRRVCEETLDYLLRDMADPAGGFHSAEDADSEGHEGKFYVWTPDEIRAVLGADADRAHGLLGRRSRAELRGPQHPVSRRRARSRRDRAARAGGCGRCASTACVPAATTRCWRPGTAWRAGRWPRRAARWAAPDYVAAAVRNAEFLLGQMRVDGRLMRTWKGGQARILGYLEDYAMVAAALIDVYEATFDRRWLDEARSLCGEMLRLFWDDALRGLLRHRRGRRAADRPAAQSLRQRGALRHLGGDRDAAAA